MNLSLYSATDIPSYLGERNSFFLIFITPEGMWWLLKLVVNSSQVIVSGAA
jgi:hypothetical protein